jgi:hypothetical protein
MSQIPGGDRDALLFTHPPDDKRGKSWFSSWTHLQTLAFICEDIWWHRSSEMTTAEASRIAEGFVREWLANSSLKHFEVWSGADCIELSQRLQVTYARFHNIHNTESTRHRYPFRRDENTDAWTLSPSTTLMRSAVSEFSEHVCTDGCWICLSMEDEDVETVISYMDDVREQDFHDRIMELTPWSIRDRDPSYKLWI